MTLTQMDRDSSLFIRQISVISSLMVHWIIAETVCHCRELTVVVCCCSVRVLTAINTQELLFKTTLSIKLTKSQRKGGSWSGGHSEVSW